MMIIKRFVRTDSTTLPGRCISVLELSPGDSGGENRASVMNTLRGDAASLDGIAISSDDWEHIEGGDVSDLLTSIKPLRVRCILISSGRDPDRIDDVMGSGYVESLCLELKDTMGDEQIRCVRVMDRYGYDYTVRIDVTPGVTDVESLKKVAELCRGCSMFIIRPLQPDGSEKGIKPFRKKDLGSMLEAVRGIVRNPRMV